MIAKKHSDKAKAFLSKQKGGFMSVLACDRAGCRNIMCDRYSHRFGYICSECFHELLESTISIVKFMNSRKEEKNTGTIWRLEELNSEFQQRRCE